MREGRGRIEGRDAWIVDRSARSGAASSGRDKQKSGRSAMYVTVRRYADKGAIIDRLVPKVRDGFVPILRQAPGFKGYCVFASEDGHAVTASVFDDREGAMRANEQARDWVAANLRDLVPDPPEVLAGEAVLHDVSKLQGGGGAEMFAAVRRYDGIGSVEEA